MLVSRPPLWLPRVLPGLVCRLPATEAAGPPSLYLTFDDGPIPDITPWVLDTLNNFRAKASFFCVGSNVAKYPHIGERILAEGHTIGNHTYHHYNGWRTDTATYIADVQQCAQVVRTNWFRPPYGRLLPGQYLQLASTYRIALWDVLAGDWIANRSAATCLNAVLRQATDGSIIVLHDSIKAAPRMQAILPSILQHFSERGYVFRALPVQHHGATATP